MASSFGFTGLGSGIPLGMAELLSRKYQIMQQEANSGSLNAQSGALTAAAGARLSDARTAGTQIENQFAPDAARASLAQQRANTRLLGVQADVTPMEASARAVAARANAFQNIASGQSILHNDVDDWDTDGSVIPALAARTMASRAFTDLTPRLPKLDENYGVRVRAGGWGR